MEIITSRQNPTVVAAAKLADKKYREQTGTFAFEGEKLLAEAMSAGVRLVRVFATEAAYQKYEILFRRIPAGVTSLVSEPVYEKLSFEKSPQGISAWQTPEILAPSCARPMRSASIWYMPAAQGLTFTTPRSYERAWGPCSA